MDDYKKVLSLYEDEDILCVFLSPAFEGKRQRFTKIADLKTERWLRFLRAANAHGSNVYASVHPLIKAQRGENNVQGMLNRIFCDFDILEGYRLFGEAFTPSVAINTSWDKYQVILLLSEPVEKTRVKNISMGFVKRYSADSCFDLSRVFRLPGFRNLKYPDRPLVKIVELNPHVSYNPQDLPIEPDPEPETKPLARMAFQGQRYGYSYFLEKAPLRGDGTVDTSRADMAYSIYLVFSGFNASEVREELLQNSIDIQKRKGKSIGRYIERTIEKAEKWVATHYKSIKRY